MFGSTVLELAIGLIFAFLLISLITSTATEAWASVRGWRANTLLQGVKDLLNDKDFTGLALKLYNHALVNPQSDGNAKTEADLTAKPSYIDAQHFATALIEELKITSSGPVPKIENAQIQKVVAGIMTRAGGDIDKIR